VGWLRDLLRAPLGWFIFGLVEFLLVVGILLAVVPDRWPVGLQAALAIAAFVGLVVFNLWMQRRLFRPR